MYSNDIQWSQLDIIIIYKLNEMNQALGLIIYTIQFDSIQFEQYVQ